MKYKNGEEFLNKLYSDMHLSEGVVSSSNKSDNPVEKISKYIDRLEKIFHLLLEMKEKH